MVSATMALLAGGATAGTAAAGAAAAAGTAGSVAAGAGAAAAATGMTLGTKLMIGSTIFSGLSSIMGGMAQKGQMDAQAQMESFNAKQELIRGREEANQVRENLARSLATAQATGAAQGIDISSGSPETLAFQAMQDADDSIQSIRRNARIGSATKRMSAKALKSKGKSAKTSGFVRGLSSLAKAGGQLSDAGAF